MVWGYLIVNGEGNLLRIDEIINDEKYRWILIQHEIPSGKSLIGNGFIFQKDNNPKNIAQKVKSYIERKERSGDIQVMKWPPQGSNLISSKVFERLFKERLKSHQNQKNICGNSSKLPGII